MRHKEAPWRDNENEATVAASVCWERCSVRYASSVTWVIIAKGYSSRHCVVRAVQC